MVQIISKRDGPRKEDVAIKRFLQENRGTIGQIKQALTGGGLPARKPSIEAPPPEVTRMFGYRRTEGAREAAPYLRISPNGRVVIADYDTGRQIHHIGDLRGTGTARRLVLATKQNGYFAPLDPDIVAPLASLDASPVPDTQAEDGLKQEIATRLGLDS